MTELESALATLAAALAPLIADAVVERLRSGPVDMTDQVSSPLGRKRHCAAVRRLVSAGKPGAAIVGRRHLLSADVLQAELAALSKRPPRVRAKAAPDEFAELRGKFDLSKKRSAA